MSIDPSLLWKRFISYKGLQSWYFKTPLLLSCHRYVQGLSPSVWYLVSMNCLLENRFLTCWLSRLSLCKWIPSLSYCMFIRTFIIITFFSLFFFIDMINFLHVILFGSCESGVIKSRWWLTIFETPSHFPVLVFFVCYRFPCVWSMHFTFRKLQRASDYFGSEVQVAE